MGMGMNKSWAKGRDGSPSLSRFHFSMFLVTFCWFVPGVDWGVYIDERGRDDMSTTRGRGPNMHGHPTRPQLSQPRNGPTMHMGTPPPIDRPQPSTNQRQKGRTQHVQDVDRGVLAGHIQHRDVEVDADLRGEGGAGGGERKETYVRGKGKGGGGAAGTPHPLSFLCQSLPIDQ